MKEETIVENIIIKPDFTMKRIGYKTFKGMVYQLKLMNNRLLKQGYGKLDFKIRLPIKLK